MPTTTVAAVLAQTRSHLRVFDPAAMGSETYTVTQVLNSTRSLLADIDTSGGEEFTDSVLAEPFTNSYREGFQLYTAFLGSPTIPSTAPTGSTSIGIPNAARFLAARTAAHAIRPREGNVLLADRFDKIADAAREEWIRFYAFADSAIIPLIQFAYREMYQVADRWSLPFAERRVSVTLTAGTTEIDLVTAGLNDVASPYRVEERLNGSADGFSIVDAVENVRGITPSANLGVYEFAEGKLKFEGATTDREIRITYLASGTAPSTGLIAIDDSLQFLALRAAALIAPSHESTKPLAEYLAKLADQTLDQWVDIRVRQQQAVILRRPAFRTY
jgi:hypothetical protein